MAKARQCDRCGEFYREYGTKGNKDNPNRIKIVCSNYRQSVFDIPDFVCDDKDLCPRCMKELKAFLNIDKEENQDSEKKPYVFRPNTNTKEDVENRKRAAKQNNYRNERKFEEKPVFNDAEKTAMPRSAAPKEAEDKPLYAKIDLD